ncbi:MAG: dTDP-4-dehydrorhamnose reductase [Methylococcales bacterium]
MKILLFGKNGQIGWELQRALAPLGQVIALDHEECNLAGPPAAIRAAVRAIQPNWIVNAAAYTAVDKAENERVLARVLNAEVPEILAHEAVHSGSWLVHYSTDYVFDGTGDKPWRETDSVAPLSVYGQTKLAGDQAIVASGCRHLIIRTCWVFGASGANFAKTIVRLARERDQLSVIDDQIGAPTGAELLADASAHAMRSAMRRPELCGVYHVAAAGEVSWYGYACFVLDLVSRLGVPLKAGSHSIHAVPTDEYLTAAKRPLNSRLDTTKFQSTFALRMTDWQSGVSRMLHELYDRIA